MNAPLPGSGTWNLARIADISLAQTAYQLADVKRIWLPSMNSTQAVGVPITLVPTIGHIGPYHADIDWKTSTGGIRGPFETSPIRLGAAPSYPVLWAHEANRERTMLFEADREGKPRRGKTAKEQTAIDQKVARIWKSASHCHYNRDFRFNSQSTSMQYTPRETIGGEAWPSIKLAAPEQEKALVAWSNTTFGMLLYWWHANKQQSGRGRSGISALESLPILDVTALTETQLAGAVSIFDSMCNQPLRPFHEIDRDDARKRLDEVFATNVLGLDQQITADGGPLELLRMKLSREPSIRGQK